MQTSPVTCSRVGGRSAPKRLLASLFFLTSMLTLPGWAAMVTTNEVGMDDIFSDDDFATIGRRREARCKINGITYHGIFHPIF